jgi:hypothetical protein
MLTTLCYQRTSLRWRFYISNKPIFAAKSYVTSEPVFAVESCINNESVSLSNSGSPVNQFLLSNPMSLENQFSLLNSRSSTNQFLLSIFMADIQVRNNLNACNNFIVWLCNIWNTWMWTCVFLEYVWWQVLWLPNAYVLICDHCCVRWQLGSDLRPDKDIPREEQVGGFHPF